jgi:DNA-binding GntR family transcriptional regulator
MNAAVSELSDLPELPALPDVTAGLNLREKVVAALRGALVAGEMRPGVVYSAPMLAQQLGVSATPVREAMLDLAKEGLVEVARNKGFRVTELSDRDLDELTEIRALIEVPTVRRVVELATAADLHRLRPVAAAIETAAVAGDLVGYVNADRRFHLDLLGIAGNAHLVSVVADLRSRARLYGLRALADRGVLLDSAREHVTLLDLIGAGDADAAAALMARHLDHVRGSWATGAPTS